MNDGLEWVGTGLYGPTNDLLRRELWAELQSVHLVWNLPWVVFGDFNVVCFPSERLGCTRLTPPMVDFSGFIESSHLVDLPHWEVVLILGVMVQRFRQCHGLIDS